MNILLKQNRPKARVKSPNPFLPRNLPEPADQTARKRRLRHQPYPRRLERAQRDVGEELGRRGRGEVDGGAVVARGLVAEIVDELLLEQFVAAELERALQEVSRGRGAEARGQRADAFVLDHLAETADHAAVVDGRFELDAGFDAGGW